MPRTSPRSPARIYLVALAVRLLNALLSRAFFQPDEYWQALEPAHRWVWGFGWETWEWRAQAVEGAKGAWWTLLSQGGGGGIRSPLAVLPTAAVYALLKAVGWKSPFILAIAPRLVQACIAASTDLAVFRLANRVLGPTHVNAALFAFLTSFFNLHTSTRTLSNSTETALTAWAWVYWPWEWLETSAPPEQDREERDKGHQAERRASLSTALAFAALATLIRPSNAVIWLFLGSHLLLRCDANRRARIVRVTAGVGLAAALFSLALDTAFYGTPTFTPLRFLHVNVLQSVSLFYGANSPHFYLSQGIPLLLATQLPFFLDGLSRLFRRNLPIRSSSTLHTLAGTMGATTAAYSLLPHKEWRFLHPLLPIMHLLVALSLHVRFASASASSSSSRLSSTLRIRPTHAAFLLASLPPAIYLTAFHGLGQARVPAVVHALQPQVRSVGYLMPCHSTAWQAGMHAPWLESADGGGERAWFLTCEPPVLGQDPSTYLDQSDFFYASPCEYLLSRLPAAVDPSFPPSPPPSPAAQATALDHDHDLGWGHAWPDALVLFSALLDVPCAPGGAGTVGELLSARGYAEERRLWNTLGGWHEDRRRRGDVRVLRWRGGAGGVGGARAGEESEVEAMEGREEARGEL
ncbi:glycosylphosphatidylinositol anchor biosynthesis [Rhodotorula kratochvilovae]